MKISQLKFIQFYSHSADKSETEETIFGYKKGTKLEKGCNLGIQILKSQKRSLQFWTESPVLNIESFQEISRNICSSWALQ